MNLSNPIDRTALAHRIKTDINDWCVRTYQGGASTRIGPSDMGAECLRFVWYKFRWYKFESFQAHQLRSFQEGFKFEPWAFEWLRGIGWDLETHTSNGKQLWVTFPNQHLGGRIDAKGKFEGLGPFLVELKTSGTGSKFTNIEVNGVKQEKPSHWVQMCVYGYRLGIQYALYLAYNKNDSSIAVEIVELDLELGASQEAKILEVINNPVPPPKISEQANYYICRMCNMNGVCHLGHEPEYNCRSCKHSSPKENGSWHCNKFNDVIPFSVIPKGCDAYSKV